MSRSLFALGAIVVLASCATQHAICPQDTTTDFDVTITQTNAPVARPAATSAMTPTPMSHVLVRYTITVVNRTNEPLRVHDLTLDTPHIVAGGSTGSLQCFGLDTLGAAVATTSRGFNTTIEPRGSADFDMTVRESLTPSVLAETAKVATLYVGVDSPRGARSEKLTRKVTIKAAQEGSHT